MTTPQPTLAGFLSFIQGAITIPTKALPPTSPWPGIALSQAMTIVNPALNQIPIPSVDAAGVTINQTGLTVYVICVYNLALDILVNLTPDAPGFSWWARLRKKLNINGFTSGVVQGTADEGTSVSLVVQDAAKMFTLSNIQNLKTIWGRTYLSLAQSYGPTTWGLS